MMVQRTYTIRLWHKSTGLKAGEMNLPVDNAIEAQERFLGITKIMEPQGYGLALMEQVREERELHRTRS